MKKAPCGAFFFGILVCMNNESQPTGSGNESIVPPHNTGEAIAAIETKLDKMPPFTPEQIADLQRQAAEMAAAKAPTPFADWLLRDRAA